MSISPDPSVVVVRDADYDTWLENIALSFYTNAYSGPLFRTDVRGLFETYLNCFSSEKRQYYTCMTCHRFLSEFGGLVTIEPNGVAIPAMWILTDAPTCLQPHAIMLRKQVARANVKGVFVSDELVLGRPVTGAWTHLAASLPEERLFKSKLLTAGQKQAEYLQDLILVSKHLENYKMKIVEQAINLLKSGHISRGEKVLGPIQWLHDLQVAIKANPGFRKNLIWRAVAMAPPGFAHFENGMSGVLLTDLVSGKRYEDIARSLGEKLGGLQYQRPQAAPAANAIVEAEKIVEKLGIAKSLQRRFARLDEVQAIWTPTYTQFPKEAGSGLVFGHLKSKEQTSAVAAPLELPVIDITWDKFNRTVLPDAKTIECQMPRGKGNFVALVTAVHMDAPPILQWDDEEQRNPVSWYCYHAGSDARHWGLLAGHYVPVTTVALPPSLWNGRPHEGYREGVLLLLEGARDSGTPGGALFPETLKSELHSIRSTIEAYSKTATIAGSEDSTACGLYLAKAGWGIIVRVNGGQRFKLDRWD